MIEGRAGSGKTMLMGFMVDQEKQITQAQSTVVLSYFFHRAGGKLQSAALGLFRSLLYQLLRLRPEMLRSFLADSNFAEYCQTKGKPGKDWDWTETELREAFGRCLQDRLPAGTAVRIYVDALDECSNGAARGLFHQLRKLCEAGKDRISLCVASRGYSPSGFRYIPEGEADFTLSVELENQSDIIAFLNERFARARYHRTEEELNQIKLRFAERASGVFQWIAWITKPDEPVTAMIESDEYVESIFEAIDGLPEELSEVYTSVLRHVQASEVAFAIRLFEVLVLGRRPLMARDVRYATCLDPGKAYETMSDFKIVPRFCQYDQQLINRAIRLSSGLIRKVEMLTDLGHPTTPVPSGGVETDQHPRCDCLQFDHESVYRFMIDKGLHLLESRIPGNSPSLQMGERHFAMGLKCLRYLVIDEIVQFAESKVLSRSIEESMSSLPAGMSVEKLTLDKLKEDEPFALYAASRWHEHIKIAEEDAHLTTAAILEKLMSMPEQVWPQIARMRKIASYGACERHQDRSTILHVISASGLHRSLNAMMADPRVMESLNTEDAGGQTPLSVAAEYGHHEAVTSLLRQGAMANRSPHSGLTPLQYAVLENHVNVVRSMISVDAVNVDAKDKGGRTPLFHANGPGYVHIAKMLVGKSKLGAHSAAVALHFGLASPLIHTPLVNAWIDGNLELLAVLLKSPQIDGSLVDGLGRSMMHYLSSCRFLSDAPESYTECARLLIDSGKFRVNQRAKYGKTAIATAARNGSRELAIFTLMPMITENDVEKVDGCTPMWEAVVRGYADIVRLLIDSGKVDVNDEDGLGRTHLHQAVRLGHVDVVRALMDCCDTDADARSHDGDTPLLLAVADDGNVSIIKALLDSDKVDPNANDPAGDTPLIRAVRAGHASIVRVLLHSATCDPHLRDAQGYMPIMTAIGGENLEVVQEIVNASRMMVPESEEDGMQPLGFAKPRAVVNGSANSRIIFEFLDAHISRESKPE